MRHGALLALVMALVTAGCGDETTPVLETAPTTTTTTTTSTTTSTTTTTTTTIPSGPAIIGDGDRGIYVEALQTLLNCAGYGTLVADGVFGDKTAAAVGRAQGAFAKEPTGEPDEETFALISRECERTELLDLGGGGSTEFVGNVADGDDDRFSVGVQEGSVLTIEADTPLSLRVEGEDGSSLSTDNGRLVYESQVAQLATIVVGASASTTYLIRVDLAAAGEGEAAEATVIEGDFNADDWIGMEWSGDLPGGLVDFHGSSDCLSEASGSDCYAYYGTIVARPGSFTRSGADNPIEAMAWLLRDTGILVDSQPVWEIVDAAVFEAPIGDGVLNDCYPQGGERSLVAFADLARGTVTGAVQWDWVIQEIRVIPPDGVVCINGAGDHIAVGPGFG